MIIKVFESMNKLLSIGFLILSIGLSAQTFNIQISSDSILYGNYIEVRFTIENLEGDFEAPDFSDFIVLSGPNITSSMQFFNGKMSSKKIYSYYLEPRDQGQFFIKPAYLVLPDNTLETIPVEINVYPNPEGKRIVPNMKNESFKFNFQKELDDFQKKPPKERYAKIIKEET